MRAKKSRLQTFYVARKLKSTCAQPTQNQAYNSLTHPSPQTAHLFAPVTQVNKCKLCSISLNLKMPDNFGQLRRQGTKILRQPQRKHFGVHQRRHAAVAAPLFKRSQVNM